MKKRMSVYLATIIAATGALTACNTTGSSTASGTVYEYMVSYFFEEENGAYALGKIDSKKIRTSEDTYSVRIPNYEGYSFNEEHENNVTELALEEGKSHRFVLYYSIAEYTVVAKLDDGTIWSEQEITYGKKAVEPTTPKKKDHVLLEWRIEGGMTYSFDSIVKSNLTLVPVWGENLESDKNMFVTATWYYTGDDGVEEKFMLASDGTLEVMTADKSDGYGTYFYGKDGFLEMEIAAGSKKGSYVAEINGLHMDFEGKDFTKNGYIINDFVSEADIACVKGSVPSDSWGPFRSSGSISWMSEKEGNALPMLVGTRIHEGAAKVVLQKLTYDGVTNTANDFIRGGATVTFPTPLAKFKDGKGLVLVYGMYMIDYKGGDKAVRSPDDEVILLNALDSEGKTGYMGLWVTMGREPNRINADWVKVELPTDRINEGEDGLIYGISMRSFP